MYALMVVSIQARVPSLIAPLRMMPFIVGPIVSARATGVEYAGAMGMQSVLFDNTKAKATLMRDVC